MSRTNRCAVGVPSARLVGDPVDVVTGAVVGVDRDFQLPGPFELLWRRHYDSRRCLEDTGVGLGFHFEYDRRLILDLDGMRYVAPDGTEGHFPWLEQDGDEYVGQGFCVERLNELRYRLHSEHGPTMDFAFHDEREPARLQRLWDDTHAVSFGYDGRGKLVSLADTLGRAVSVTWNSAGRMERVVLRDPTQPGDKANLEQRAASYEYDAAGRLLRTTDPYGHHLQYAYDRAGRLTRFTDRNGYSFHYSYDQTGRCVQTRGDDGVEEVHLVYEPTARITQVTRGNGGTWQYIYNDGEALTQVVDPNGGVTEYLYDSDGKLVREIDSASRLTTEYEYDDNGALNVLSSPTGEGISPDEPHDPFVAMDRRYRIHRLPDPVQRSLPQGELTVADVEQGSLLDVGEPESPGYALPVEGSRLPFVSLQEWQSLVRVDQPGLGGVVDVRDSFGLLVRQERHDGPARQYGYDSNGNLTRLTDFDGARTRYEYASWNHLVRRIDPLDQVTEFEYDVDENLARLRDPGGTTSEFAYDKARNLTEARRSGALRAAFANDIAGRVIERANADGDVELRIAYDGQGLLSQRTLESGDQQEFEYGNLGALARQVSGAGEVELNPTIEGGYYNSDLRDGEGVEHQRTWGAGVDTTTVLKRFVVKYYRFRDGKTQMVVAPGGVVHRLRLCGAGVVRRELAGGAVETVQYSPRGRVLARLRADPSGRRHDTLYTYSGEGDLLRVADSEHGVTRYEYDAAHRLVTVHPPQAAAAEHYEYDSAGNLLHMPGLNYFGTEPDDGPPPADPSVLRPSTDGVWLQAGNRLYRAHGDYFSYNARGHIEKRHSSRCIVSYEYDELDQLRSVQDTDGLRVQYRYDGLGRRTDKLVGDQHWVYYWSGDRLAAEVFPDGKLRIYVYPDLDDALSPFAFVDYPNVDADPEDGTHYLIYHNHQGTPVQVTDTDGNVVWEALVEPYGKVRVHVGEDFHQPLRFPGHYHDLETDLHYNRYRYYMPSLGRYLQSDPIDLEGGHNLYAYAQESNPLRDVDLFGLACPIAEGLLKQARRGREPLLKSNGSPGKPLSKMTPLQRQLFCAARARQLEAHLGPDSRVTICVSIVKTRVNGRTRRRIMVTSSEDSGTVPARVRRNMRTEGPNAEYAPEGRLVLADEAVDNNGQRWVHADAQDARDTHGNRDGKVMATDRETGDVEAYQKRNARNKDGDTLHHAEQRSEAALQPGESIEAMGPSRACCPGCQEALGPPRRALDKVHPALRGQ